MASKKGQHQFSAEERIEALKEMAEHGVPATVRKLHISKTTLYKWRARQRAGVAEADGAAAGDGNYDDELPMGAEEKSPHRRSRVAKTYTPSQRAQALEYAAKHGATAASKKYGMSRVTIHEWRRKVRLAAEGKGDCPTSGPDQNDIEAQRDREILNIWQKHPGLGPSQVKNQLRRQGVKISVNTVRHVMEEAGYRPPKLVRRKHDKKFDKCKHCTDTSGKRRVKCKMCNGGKRRHTACDDGTLERACNKCRNGKVDAKCPEGCKTGVCTTCAGKAHRV